MSELNNSVLVIAEHNNAELKPSTLNTITAAMTLGEVEILIAGHQCQSVAEQAAQVSGVKKVFIVDAAQYAHGLAEEVAALIVGAAEQYTHILAPATTYGKNIMPRAAALLDMSCISDIAAIESKDTFIRPIYAGNALATVQSSDKIKILTVRVSAFDAATKQDAKAPVGSLAAAAPVGLSSFVKQELTKSERPEITAADIVISGGRGMGSEDNFKLIEDIASKLNAAIGASRAAVDAGYVPNDYQVGQTGKIIAPKLYIAVGISGAIQHLAGMKDSKVIVAINKDPEAPIFSIANYGLVGDLFQILPELSSELDKAL